MAAVRREPRCRSMLARRALGDNNRASSWPRPRVGEDVGMPGWLLHAWSDVHVLMFFKVHMVGSVRSPDALKTSCCVAYAIYR